MLRRIIELSVPLEYWRYWITAWISASVVTVPAAEAVGFDAPYVVAVMKSSRLSCSGFLISTQYVGVTCHCIASMGFGKRPTLNGKKLVDYDFVAGVTAANMLLQSPLQTRKPRALLTHPYCEDEPPPVYDIGIAVMDTPFQTIPDKIEVFDMFRTDTQAFVKDLAALFSWKNLKNAPNCTYAGWRITPKWEKSDLMTVEMINIPTNECRKIWRQVDNTLIPHEFDFERPEQFCLVTRNKSEDDFDLPTDGPLVCQELYVGMVIYGPERRERTRAVPIVTQSLAVILDWMKEDEYFERTGCFGKDSNCGDDYYDIDEKDAAVRTTMGLGIIMSSILSNSLLPN